MDVTLFDGAYGNEEYSIYSKFDLQKHKNMYINYLEVVIDNEGDVHYAVPSHSEKLIRMICQNMNIDRETLYDMVPETYRLSMLEWLCMKADSVAVYTDMVVYHSINSKQINTIKTLREEGVYKGFVPENEGLWRKKEMDIVDKYNVRFEESVPNSIRGTETLYFMADSKALELIGDTGYPDAVSSEISIEIKPDSTILDVQSVEMSPTDINGCDYDWHMISVSKKDIVSLIVAAKQSQEQFFVKAHS